MATNYRNYDNSTHINYPDTVKVHEYKAPTDESIRLMQEVHDNAVQNIIAKVKVEDNLVNGECFCIEQPWNLYDVKMVFKFKINGKEFVIEKEISRRDIGLEDNYIIERVNQNLQQHAASVMLWYAIKVFTAVAYEQIAGHKYPDFFLK